MRASRLVLLLGPALVLAAACGRGGPAKSPEVGVLRVVGVGSSVDPTIRSARLLPEIVDETTTYGSEAGGGLRAITASLRVVTTHEGAIIAAEERFPQPPTLTQALPDRLGGGFLFVLGSTIWRADHWLESARPIFASTQTIQAIVPGLDRVYIRTGQSAGQSAYLAIDGKSGAVLDLGPWPASPYVFSYAAADGWRAAAATDLRGVVATYDAGATWRALDLPIEPRQVLVSGDSLAIGGVENGKSEAWFEARPDGTIARLSSPPREAKGKPINIQQQRPGFPSAFPSAFPGGFSVSPVPTLSPTRVTKSDVNDSAHDESVQDTGTRIFGKRPLAAAIEDGWPLTDGTALVARDGALGRVRLSDGALTEVAQSAFSLKPSRCHPVSLTRPNAIGAFGFVCGEPRGATVLYAFDPLRGRMTELKRFDRPRVITSSGNGAIAVRGPCAEDGDASGTPREPLRIEPKSDAGADGGDGIESLLTRAAERERLEKEAAAKAAAADAAHAAEIHPFCVLGQDNTWREVHVRGDVGGERVVVLADGVIAVVSPPQGSTVPARITFLQNGKATTLPVVFPTVTADIARVLRLGVWLDGFEERRPGVVGGWLEAGGAMLGIEIAADGKAKVGQFIRDAGTPFVSGRYGLGWTTSRRGFETTDGGMTWTSLELPEQLVPTNKVERRACGPIGCLANGWLRVGWGEAKKVATTPPPPPHRTTVSSSTPQLTLSCEPTSSIMPTPAPPKPKAPPTIPTVTLTPNHRTFGGPSVLAPTGITGLAELPAFFSQAGPVLHDPERGIPIDVTQLIERYPSLSLLGRLYAWGPKSGDWDTQGKWQVRWLSPFAGWTDSHASLPVLPPTAIVDLTKTQSQYGGGYYNGSYALTSLFQIASGDDPTHALLLARPQARTHVTPIELEADRAPVEIHRADGEPFVEIDAVARAAGRWFIATPPAPGLPSPVTTIWQVDGNVARELVRVQRAALETNRPSGQGTTHLARRSDGRAIGLVVDGQMTAERTTTTRWVLPIDLETAQLGEPELLGYSDLGGRTLEACTDEVVGWVFDTSLSGTSVRVRMPQGTGAMHSVYARVRLTSSRACVERIAGQYDGQSPERVAQLTRAGAHLSTAAPTKSAEIIASAFAGQSRYALKCAIAK